VEFNWYTPHQWAWRVREQREDADAPLYMAGYKLPPAHGQDQERVQYVAHKTADGWGPWELEEDLEDSPQEAALESLEVEVGCSLIGPQAELEEGLAILESLPEYPTDCATCGRKVGLGDSQAWSPAAVHCKSCFMAGAIDKEPGPAPDPKPYICDYCSIALTRLEVIKCGGRYFCDDCATAYNHKRS